MTQIGANAAAALLKGQKSKAGNTQVVITPHDTIPKGFVADLYLYGSRIVTYNNITGEVKATLAGYPTVTTRDRINAVAEITHGVGVYQRDYKQILEGDYGSEIGEKDWWVVRNNYNAMHPLLQKVAELD